MDQDSHAAVVNHPYSVGVMLAVNALSDARLLLDAPLCAQWRPGFVQGSHDTVSTLWDPWGDSRSQVSATTTERIVSGNRKDLARLLAELARQPGCGAVLAAGFPMARLSGSDYEAVWRGLRPAPAVPFFPVGGGALSHDWLDGYAHVLLTLARGLRLPARRRRAEDAAIVGYMFDRGERDHAANLAELRRMLAGIGLRLVSVWPGGGRVADLAAAAGAGVILSFPYGREAAAELARRTGAALVRCRLPLGLKDSADWLAEVGAGAGCRGRAEEFAARELKRLLPRLEWAVEELFLHSRFFFTGDPFMIRPLARQLADLGGRLTGSVAAGGRHHAAEHGSWSGLPFPVLDAPSHPASEKLMEAMLRKGPIDCWIGDGGPRTAARAGRRPVELGYPSFHSHAFHDRPFLGFAGALCLLGRVAEEVQWGRERLTGAARSLPKRPRRC